MKSTKISISTSTFKWVVVARKASSLKLVFQRLILVIKEKGITICSKSQS